MWSARSDRMRAMDPGRGGSSILRSQANVVDTIFQTDMKLPVLFQMTRELEKE